MVFVKGKSGNPAGRPAGSRQRLAETFIGDLHRKWQDEGEDILERVAKDDPKAVLQAMTTLMPKDVAISVSQTLPGNMTPDEWAIMVEVVRTIRDNTPTGSTALPRDLLPAIADATRAFFAIPISRELP